MSNPDSRSGPLVITAELRAAYEATHYRVETPDGLVTVKVGKIAPEQLWRDAKGVRPERWAIVSAFNPFSQALPEQQNRERHEELQRRLAANGRICLPASGIDPEEKWPAEKSLAILNLANDELDDLMLAFGQNAVVVAERGRAAYLLFHPHEVSRQSSFRGRS